MAAIKRAHHVVPQFYLRRFADDLKQIYQTDKTNGAAALTPVKHATVVRDLYTVDGNEGDELDTLEDIYSRIESDAARVFKSVLDDDVWPLNDQQREAMSIWIAAQFLRTPRMRNALDESMNEHRKHIESLSLDDVRTQLGDAPWSDAELEAKWKETLEYYSVDGPQPRNAQARWFGHLLEEATRGMFLRNWHLARFDAPVLLTSDSPVLPMREDGSFQEVKNPAAAFLTAVPLDRATLLLIQPTRATLQGDRTVQQTREFASMINLVMAEHADQYVFEHPEDKIHENLPVLAD